MNLPKKIVYPLVFVLAAGALLAFLLSMGWIDLPFDGTLILDDDDFHGGVLGGMLGLTIAGIVLLFVGVLLAAVFAGVSLVLLAVAVIVCVVLLVVAIPFLLPVVALIAVPLMMLYALFRFVTRPAQPA